IRDRNVTGVQTCALPIYFENETGERIDCQKINGNLFFYNVTGLGFEEEIEYVQIGDNFIANRRKIKQNQIAGELDFYEMTYDERSEERRVGKDDRCK